MLLKNVTPQKRIYKNKSGSLAPQKRIYKNKFISNALQKRIYKKNKSVTILEFLQI